jgi:spectinomycin phosphotransferase
MLERPDLPDATILACVRASYGIPVVEIDFLPLGNDSSAWAYRAWTADGPPYFLKVKKGGVDKPSVLVPRYLRDSGIEQVIAPLPTRAGELATSVDSFSVILYPFIEGRIGMEVGLSASQWIAFGSLLKQIHSSPVPAALSRHLRRETFTPKWGPVVKELQHQITADEYESPLQRELAAFWKARDEEIRRILHRAAELGRMLQLTSPELILCHADIHTANVLIDAGGQLFIVDWDETILAPKERDLMFVVGATAEELFFRGYGTTAIDPVTLAYYRYEWVVQEIGDFGERVFLMPKLGQETQRDALRGFRDLFQPGDVVQAACASDPLRWSLGAADSGR